jgi:hypothetical protein
MLTIESGKRTTIHIRLANQVPEAMDADGGPFGQSFDKVFADRRREADEFYASITPKSVGEDAANVMR